MQNEYGNPWGAKKHSSSNVSLPFPHQSFMDGISVWLRKPEIYELGIIHDHWNSEDSAEEWISPSAAYNKFSLDSMKSKSKNIIS